MPFGLTNTPATQQRFIEAVLNGLIWDCCFAYIDDILCYSNSFENHLRDLERIFQRLQDHDLRIQPAKCAFCKPQFSILGFIASKDGLSPDPRKVQAINDYPYPSSPKEIESFLGMVSWLRKFIPRWWKNFIDVFNKVVFWLQKIRGRCKQVFCLLSV